MPIYNLRCPKCWSTKRVVRSPGWKASEAKLPCTNWQKCGGIYERNSDAAQQSTLVKETIDNGVMVKSLERLADAERLHKDRVEIEDALQKGKDPGRPIR